MKIRNQFLGLLFSATSLLTSACGGPGPSATGGNEICVAGFDSNDQFTDCVATTFDIAPSVKGADKISYSTGGTVSFTMMPFLKGSTFDPTKNTSPATYFNIAQYSGNPGYSPEVPVTPGAHLSSRTTPGLVNVSGSTLTVTLTAEQMKTFDPKNTALYFIVGLTNRNAGWGYIQITP